MTHIENKEDIKVITMKPTACTLCAIGQDWFNNQLEISFTPDKCYPDYIEVRDWIMDNIDGKELNIEQVVDRVFRFLDEEYKPKSLHITDYVIGCKSHFDVVVEK